MNTRDETRAGWSLCSNPPCAPGKRIQLEAPQAERWLKYLETLPPSAGPATMLAEFREQLDDAIWLAHWKREYVVIEIALAVVPSLIEAIVSHEPSYPSERSLDMREDILATLSRMSGLF